MDALGLTRCKLFSDMLRAVSVCRNIIKKGTSWSGRPRSFLLTLRHQGHHPVGVPGRMTRIRCVLQANPPSLPEVPLLTVCS